MSVEVLGELDHAVEAGVAQNPYQQIAADISSAIAYGALPSGEPLPTIKALAERYQVSVGTAHRAVALLSADGKVDVRSGRRTIVTGWAEQSGGVDDWPHAGLEGRDPGKGSREGQGWVLRQYSEAGNATGPQIRWHPGGGHHGPDPYWRVVGPNGDLGGVVR